MPDGFGNLTKTTDPGGHVTTYAYNVVGFLETVTYPASTGTPVKVVYAYETANKSGILESVSDYYSPYTTYWKATAVDAFGQYQDVTLGNGLETYRDFDSITGAIRRIETGPGGGTGWQLLDYTWNKAGYLTQRKDLNQSLTEDFDYDDLYRLDDSARNSVANLDLAYA